MAIFDSTTFTQSMLSNPSKMASTVISAMEASDIGSNFTINDPNNGFTLQLLASLSIYSKFSEKIDYFGGFLYPQRARNAEQLNGFLSEFDYTQLMASPAELSFVFAMSKDWIIANAVYFDSNYNKLVIPATSYITMGNIAYSMYYPIEILVNRNTGAVDAFYDTSVSNSLNTLSSNMLDQVQQYTMAGINYFVITFKMYQFARTVTNDAIGANQGYIKTLTFDDQFYAVKVYTVSNGIKTELAYSLSSMYYDYTTPTALLSLLSDASQLKIEIPQIYFDNNQISTNIYIELYTTKGQVNYSLSPADVNSLTANFDTSSSIFAAPFAQMPTWLIRPTVLDVAGGSNVLSYAQVRDATVNQRLYDRVAVTTPEIIEAGKKAGFDLTRVTDDLTERVYFASNILTDGNGIVIPTFAGNILIANDSLTGNPSSILNYPDGHLTILPTTTFTIANNGLTCTPMTDGQVSALAQMTNQQLVSELNNSTYVRQPFHITLTTAAKSPQSLIYNLLSPSMTSLTFISENAHSAPQMSATSCTINHLGNGTGGYDILFGVTRSSNILQAAAGVFKIVLTCLTKTGKFVYLPATYQSTNQYGIDTWLVKLATTYHITADDFLTVMMYDATDTLMAVEIPLNQTFTILTGFVSTYEPTVPVDPSLNPLLPPSYQSLVTVMAQQTALLSLGTNLSSQIYCGVNTSWGNDVYKLADETVYYTTDVPLFQLTETGVINTRYNSTTKSVEVVVIYPQGSIPSSTNDLVYTSVVDTLVITNTTTSSFTLTSVAGLLVGMPARGTNIPPNSVVTKIAGNVVTLNNPVTSKVPSGTVITFSTPTFAMRTTAAQTAKGVQLTVASTQGLVVGYKVFGFDLAVGDTIVSIDSPTQFSVSSPSVNPIANNTLLTIINTTAPGVIKTQIGDVITDPTGAPVIVKDAQNQYLIPSILFDGRLFASEDPGDVSIVSTISSRLQNYANQIATIDAGLIEDSDVYYKPSRTMGYANFGIGGSKTISMSLELSFSFDVYVDPSVYNSQNLQSTMTSSILGIVNMYIQKPIISVSDITAAITTALGTNVSAVEGGDISGVSGLRLISLENSSASPSIENILSVQADGTITRSPNVKINYLPKPDTTETTSVAL